MSDQKRSGTPHADPTAPLVDFLRSMLRDAPGDWAEQLRDDQGRRWRAGERVRVEDYLRHLPALDEHTDALLDLIYNEVLLREANGEHPQLAELQERFPQHGDALARQWEVHRVIEDQAPGDDLGELAGGVGSSSFDLVLPSDADQDGLIETTGGEGRANHTPKQPGTSQEPAISGYDILEELGRGGNGVVYLARQRSLNRLVAIKMIAPDRTLTASQVARIRTEAELIARLQHPHIVAIHRVGLCDNQPYLVLEYVFGGSLADRMGGPWPASAAMTLVETLAQTLAVVHEQGIVHRDLKPANILLQTASENTPGKANGSVPLAAFAIPKLVDFGLAKTLTEGDPAGRGLTKTGELLGTPAYMAPEQVTCKNDRIGPATDLHALGVILYELLTGKLPFEANNAFDMLAAIAFNKPMPPSRLVKGVPADLDAIVLRCLAKEPEQRYGSALELAEDLHRVRHGFPSRSRKVGLMERLWLWSCRQPAVAALFVVFLLTLVSGLGAVSVQWQRAESALDMATRSQTELESALVDARVAWNEAARSLDQAKTAEKKLTETNKSLKKNNEALAVFSNRLARDQKDLRETLAKLGETSENLKATLAQSLVTLAEGERNRHRFFRAEAYLDQCPEGFRGWEWHYLARLCRMRLATLGPLTEEAGCVAISPDDRWMASVSSSHAPTSGVCLWDTATDALARSLGETGTSSAAAPVHPHDRAPLPSSRTLPGRNSVAFRPGGKWLATVSPAGGILLYPLSALRDLPAPPAVGTLVYRKLTWSPDGRYLAAKRDNTVHLWSFNGEGKPLAAEPLLVPRPWMEGGTLRDMAFRPDGKVLALAAGDRVCFYDLLAQKIQRPAAARQTSKGGRKPAKAGPPVQIKHEGESSLTTVAWAGNKRLVAGASDGILRVYDMPARTFAFALEGHTMAVVGLGTAGKEESVLASVASDGTGRIWDLEQRKETARFTAHKAIALDRRGKRMLTGQRKRQLIVWSARPPVGGSPQNWHSEPVPALAFSPKGALATGAGRVIQVHDPRSLARIGRIETPAAVRSLAFHPRGRLLAIGMGTSGVGDPLRLSDMQTQQETALAGPSKEPVLAVAFSRDGRLLASGGQDGSVTLWQGTADNPAWKLVRQFTGHKGAVTGVALSPDGRALASTGRDGQVLVSEVSTGRLLWSEKRRKVRGVLPGRKDDKEAEREDKEAPVANLCGVAFSADGKQIATVGRFGAVVLLNSATGAHEGLLVGHTGTANGIAYSPDGQRLATGGADGTVRLWDPQRGVEVLTLGGHTRGILALAFSADGRFLATSGKDRIVLLHESPIP